MSERLTWEEIKERYPNQYVALTNIYPSEFDIQETDVLYVETGEGNMQMSENDILLGCLRGKWYAFGTNIDSAMELGCL
jgi:hypothetical protein